MDTTLSDGQGGRVPNLAAIGLRWRTPQKLAEELDDLWRRQRENGDEERALAERIRTLEAEHARARALALRGGEEPDEAPLREAREELQTLDRRRQDLRRAAEMARADLLKVVATDGGEWGARAQEEGAKALEEAREAAAVLSAKLRAADRFAAVYEWIESGGERYAPSVGAEVSIEALVHERERALGLVEVGVIG